MEKCELTGYQPKFSHRATVQLQRIKYFTFCMILYTKSQRALGISVVLAAFILKDIFEKHTSRLKVLTEDFFCKSQFHFIVRLAESTCGTPMDLK